MSAQRSTRHSSRSHPARRAHGPRGRRVLVRGQRRDADAPLARYGHDRAGLAGAVGGTDRTGPLRAAGRVRGAGDAGADRGAVRCHLGEDLPVHGREARPRPARGRRHPRRRTSRAECPLRRPDRRGGCRVAGRSPRASPTARSCSAWISPTAWPRSTCRASSSRVRTSRAGVWSPGPGHLHADPVPDRQAGCVQDRRRTDHDLGGRGIGRCRRSRRTARTGRTSSCRRSSWSGRRGARPSATLSA